ncbi:hypothetical protein BDW22DRAFT_840015 [Trametopsis cervina]|nr:hypothetical protein BDW22DRAFT_840015 [Trametopsis cervina]
MGVRRDTELDLLALVEADKLFMDDGFFDKVVRLCLRRMPGKGVVFFVRQFIKHRTGHASKDGPLLSVDDFSHLSTRALVATTEILSHHLERVMRSHTKASDIVHEWAQDSFDYILTALEHCDKAPRDPGPVAVSTSNLLAVLLTCGRPAIKKVLIMLTHKPRVLSHLHLHKIPVESIPEAFHCIAELVQEKALGSIDLCATLLQFVDHWAARHRHLPNNPLVDVLPFEQLVDILRDISLHIQEEYGPNLGTLALGPADQDKFRNCKGLLGALSSMAERQLSDDLGAVLDLVCGGPLLPAPSARASQEGFLSLLPGAVSMTPLPLPNTLLSLPEEISSSSRQPTTLPQVDSPAEGTLSSIPEESVSELEEDSRMERYATAGFIDSPSSFERSVDRTRFAPDLSFEFLLVLTSEDLQEPFHMMPCPARISDLDVSDADWENLVEDVYDFWQRGGQAYFNVGDLMSIWNDMFFSRRGVELKLLLARHDDDPHSPERASMDDREDQDLRSRQEDPGSFRIYLKPLPQPQQMFERASSRASSSHDWVIHVTPPSSPSSINSHIIYGNDPDQLSP